MVTTTTLGSGLVEIAALTALIGSKTVESLTLGSRGAAGLPWASISSFGALFLLKSCVAACTPGWLRDTLGVRNSRTDAAIGLTIDLRRRTLGKSSGEQAVGVLYSDKQSKVSRMEDVYEFDTCTSLPLRSCATNKADVPVEPCIYGRDIHWRTRTARRARRDWIGLVASTVKLIESAVLLRIGAYHLYWVTALPWFVFFVSAAVLQCLGLSREQNKSGSWPEIDVLSGSLPTPQAPGGARKVLLGAPQNVRTGYQWYLVWALGGVVTLTSLVGTYMLLSQNSTIDIYTWAGFQLLWLALRSVFFHLSDDIEDVMHTVAVAEVSKDTPVDMPRRMSGLVAAVSRYQMLRHPRGAYSYEEDLRDVDKIIETLDKSKLTFLVPLGPLETAARKTVELEITAIVGDTLLSSATWFYGAVKLTGMELYDCCLVEIVINKEKLLVPAARVLSGPLQRMGDIETPEEPAFIPRNTSNDGINIRWLYWLPLADHRWLEVVTQEMQIKGKMQATVLNETELTRLLSRGHLYVSHSDASHIDAVVQLSRIAVEYLYKMQTFDPTPASRIRA